MTPLEFFTTTMDDAVKSLRDELLVIAKNSPGPELALTYASGLVSMESCMSAHLGTSMIEAMGRALLKMKLTEWELFYHGYAQWSRQRGFVAKDHAEENARGGMLLAIKTQWEASQQLLGCCQGGTGELA